MSPSHTDLVLYDAACRAITEAKRVDEVKLIRDKWVAFQKYAVQAKDRTLIDGATDIRMRAEIRLGELLREMEKNKGARAGGQKDGPRGRFVRPRDTTPRLSDFGITKSQSSRWQALAALPGEMREARIAVAKRKQRAALDGTGKHTREEIRAADEQRVRSLVPRPGRYRTLVIDPPWEYRLVIGGRSAPPYATMTQEQMLVLPVASWAEDDCHLYLWTTNAFVPSAVALMEHWGFQHKTILTWHKQTRKGTALWGIGNYFRNTTEHVLFGVRGRLRTRVDDIPTHFEAPTRGHSEKPDVFYDIVRRASYLPAGEAFQRKARTGFVNLFEQGDVLRSSALVPILGAPPVAVVATTEDDLTPTLDKQRRCPDPSYHCPTGHRSCVNTRSER